MTKEATDLRARLEKAKQELEAATGSVAYMERSCKHSYGAPVSTPIVRPAYRQTSMGWHPGHGNEDDHQVYVPEQRTPCWSRTCANCGKVETTTDTKEKTLIEPRFSR